MGKLRTHERGLVTIFKTAVENFKANIEISKIA